MKYLLKNHGFTLMETTLYFFIVSILMFSLTMFGIKILNNFRLSENMHDMQSSSSVIADKIVEAIQNADSVDVGNSVFDDDNGQLDLTSSPQNISIYLQDQDIYFDNGPSAIKLNSDSTRINSLRFHRIVEDKVPDQIVIDCEIESVSTLPELQRTFLLHTITSIRY